MVDLTLKQGTENAAGALPTEEPLVGDIRQEWAWVKSGIDEILAEQPQLTFRAEDVYAEVVMGKAVLWVAPEGFVITSHEQDQFNGDMTFLLWLAWAKKRSQNCAIKYYDFFAQNAKEAGYKKIETRTPIQALEDYLLAEGWDKDTVVYTREL